MARLKRLLSSLLLASGIVLVFTGLAASLGFTLGGMLASIAAIAALLFAGGVWFGHAPAMPAPAGAETVVIFDRDLAVATGLTAGASILDRFPEPLRPEIERRCRAALRGESSRFTCDVGGRRLQLETAPVPTASPFVLYGILITATGVTAPALPAAPVATTA
jgi:hypothetical protein